MLVDSTFSIPGIVAQRRDPDEARGGSAEGDGGRRPGVGLFAVSFDETWCFSVMGHSHPGGAWILMQPPPGSGRSGQQSGVPWRPSVWLWHQLQHLARLVLVG